MKSISITLPPMNTKVYIDDLREICQHYHLSDAWDIITTLPPERPFKSDGMSGIPIPLKLAITEITGFDFFYEACFIHDIYYWCGKHGDEVGRLIADAELMMRIAKQTGNVILATAIFDAVRIGGSERLPNPWRWGFGRERGIV